mmetsp:Transcript_14645/g.43663  ORF Transcript_14645/g.43663 Transcript_14645/m.43663 type:complete len:438 (+) Transcript_14645:1-1314(+)
MTHFFAEGVKAQTEGKFGTSDPQLWIYQRVGGRRSVQKKSSILADTLMPVWTDADACVLLDNSELCFEIRDDFPYAPKDPDILNQGCTTSLSPGMHHVFLDHGCTLNFKIGFYQPVPSPPPLPPPTLPSPPYDYRVDNGPLSTRMCQQMLHDPNHIFRKMWAADPWTRLKPGRASCFEKERDNKERFQDIETYFREAKDGVDCHTNWYEGNQGELGIPGAIPKFTGRAPALLGFDETIDGFCNYAKKYTKNNKYFGHAGNCVNANLNILSLYGDRVPYNICRNLEWQVCAAKGMLPGQGGRLIRFAKRPRDLYPNGDKPLAKCRGWRAPGAPPCDDGYATDDIFFLETCLYNQICNNGDELFSLDVGTEFYCDFSESRFDELQQTLTDGLSGSKALSPKAKGPETVTCGDCYKAHVQTGSCASVPGCTPQLCNFCAI